MRNFQLWAVAQLLLSGTVSGLEKRLDCQTQVTTTVFVPITIFVTIHPSATALSVETPTPGNTERYSQVATSKKCGGSKPTSSQAATSTAEASVVVTIPAGNTGFTTTTGTTGVTTSVISATQVVTSATSTAQAATSVASGVGATSAATGNTPSPTEIPGTTPGGPFNGYTNAAYFTNWWV
jgi:hypothetical protein